VQRSYCVVHCGVTSFANALLREQCGLTYPSFQAIHHTAPSLRLFFPNSVTVSHLLFFLRGVLCDVLLPVGRLLRHDHSPTAPPAPSLRVLVPSSSLIRRQGAVWHSTPGSILFCIYFSGLILDYCTPEQANHAFSPLSSDLQVCNREMANRGHIPTYTTANLSSFPPTHILPCCPCSVSIQENCNHIQYQTISYWWLQLQEFLGRMVQLAAIKGLLIINSYTEYL
jgi:hypothetical protein